MPTNREILQQSYANSQAKGWKTITPLFFGILSSVYLFNGFPNLQLLIKASPTILSASYVGASYKNQKDKVEKSLTDWSWVESQLLKDKEAANLLTQIDLDAAFDSGGGSGKSAKKPTNKRPVSPVKASALLNGTATRDSEVLDKSSVKMG